MSAARELLQWLIDKTPASDREKGDVQALLDQAHPAETAPAPDASPGAGAPPVWAVPGVPPEGGSQL